MEKCTSGVWRVSDAVNACCLRRDQQHDHWCPSTWHVIRKLIRAPPTAGAFRGSNYLLEICVINAISVSVI